MVVGNLVLFNPFCNVVWLGVFDVARKFVAESRVPRQWRTASFSSTLCEISVPVIRMGKLFQDEQSGKSLHSGERPLENSWVDPSAIYAWPADFEATARVFGESIFVRGRPSREVDGVHLGHEGCQSSWRRPHLFTIVGQARTVDVETGENLRDALVETENNLDMANRILRDNSDSILRTDSCRFGQDTVADLCFDLFDLLDGLFFGQAIQEQINIGGRSKGLMVVSTERTL